METTLARVARRGGAAGAVSAGVNLTYFAVYRAATGFAGHEPTLVSVIVSSLLPCLLGALGYLALLRVTRRAARAFVVTTAVIIVLSFEGLLRDGMPDGTPKPAGFDALVMPMHVVVGLAAVLFIPRP